MSEPRRITSEDLALYAMQLLSKEETAEVTAYLQESAEARRELAEIQGDLAIYAHTVDLRTPPAQARERLMKQVAREKKAIPIDRPSVPEARAEAAGNRGPDWFGLCRGSCAYRRVGKRRPIERARAGQQRLSGGG